MKNIDPEKIKELLKKPWLTHADMYAIYPCGEGACRDMFNKARIKAIDENYFVPVTRPAVVPTECVISLFPIGKKHK